MKKIAAFIALAMALILLVTALNGKVSDDNGAANRTKDEFRVSRNNEPEMRRLMRESDDRDTEEVIEGILGAAFLLTAFVLLR